MDGKYETDAVALRTALEGFGADEATIMKITAKRSNKERQMIRTAYAASFGRDLLEDLDDKLGGNFKLAVVGCFLNPVEYDVNELFFAFKGAGTNEDTVSEIIGSRNNRRLQEIKDLYKQKHGETLEDRIKEELSGDYEKLLISLCQCKRNESDHVNKSEVEEEVKLLYNAGEGKCGTDEETFNRIFALRSPAHLACLNQQYHHVYGKTLLDVVESEFSGDVKVLLKTILHSHINPVDYFAERIYLACKGWGTNDKVLVRSIITTDESLLKDIKKLYVRKYNMTLDAQITDETSGDYKQMLLDLVAN